MFFSNYLNSFKKLASWLLNISCHNYIFYPAFTCRSDLIDQLYRYSWYFPNRKNIKTSIYYYGFDLDLKTLNNENLRPKYMHSNQINFDGICFVNKRTRFIGMLLNIIINRTAINWKKDLDLNSFFIKFLKFVIVDHTISSYRSDINYVSLSMKSAKKVNLRKAYQISQSIFVEKVNYLKTSYKKTYIFGRGPSLENALNSNFSDGARIVCNQIVNNYDLMNSINPNIIIAGDHCWNMGCSKLSDYFRNDTLKWLTNNDAFFVVPFDSYQLIINHFPLLIDKLVGIPYGCKDHNLNLLNNFNTKSSLGVFFEFLFPIACTLSNEVLMLGFDGYSKKEKNNKVAYSHYKPSEYPQSIVSSIYDSRPGYYDQKFDNFRSKYDELFIEILDCATNNNIVVNTLAPSNHSALRDKLIKKPNNYLLN